MRIVAAMDYGRPLELGAKWSSCGYALERMRDDGGDDGGDEAA